jgi:transcriptional regulator with XRE-family HTH domain
VDLTQLKDIRKAKGYSIKEVANKAGMDRDRVSRIERGKINPSFSSVMDIAKAIGAKILISYE